MAGFRDAGRGRTGTGASSRTCSVPDETFASSAPRRLRAYAPLAKGWSPPLPSDGQGRTRPARSPASPGPHPPSRPAPSAARQAGAPPGQAQLERKVRTRRLVRRHVAFAAPVLVAPHRTRPAIPAETVEQRRTRTAPRASSGDGCPAQPRHPEPDACPPSGTHGRHAKGGPALRVVAHHCPLLAAVERLDRGVAVENSGLVRQGTDHVVEMVPEPRSAPAPRSSDCGPSGSPCRAFRSRRSAGWSPSPPVPTRRRSLQSPPRRSPSLPGAAGPSRATSPPPSRRVSACRCVQPHQTGQTRLTVTSHHGRREAVAAALRIARFFRAQARSEEQLTAEDRWRRIPRRGAQEIPPRPRAKPSIPAAAPSGRASVQKSSPKSTARTVPRRRSLPPTARFRLTCYRCRRGGRRPCPSVLRSDSTKVNLDIRER